MSGKRIGYARVSTLEQNPESQLQGIEIDRFFVEKISAKDTERPVLQEMLNYIRDDDIVIVHRIDRLARSNEDLRSLVKIINSKKASIKFISEGLHFDGNDSPLANLMLNIVGAFAEFERNIGKERQREGILNAQKKGLYKGRKPAFSVEECKKIHYMINELGMSKGKVAREYGVSTPTIYAYLRGKSKPYKERRK